MDNLIYEISQEKGLSDIHFQTGMPIAIRVNGSIIKQENNSISKEQISNLKKSAIVFDIIYQPLKTKLLEIADNSGIATLNDLK